MIDTNQQIAIAENVILRQVKDDAVLLNLTTQEYFTLNDSGARMLQELIISKSIDQALSVLASEYDVETSLLKADLLKLVGLLIKQGLVVIR